MSMRFGIKSSMKAILKVNLINFQFLLTVFDQIFWEAFVEMFRRKTIQLHTVTNINEIPQSLIILWGVFNCRSNNIKNIWFHSTKQELNMKWKFLTTHRSCASLILRGQLKPVEISVWNVHVSEQITSSISQVLDKATWSWISRLRANNALI